MHRYRAHEQTLKTGLIKIAAIASLSGVCFGYSVGIAAIITAMGSFQAYFGPTTEGVVLAMVLFFLGGAVLGSLLSGPMADRFGRKCMMQWSALLFSIASIIGVGALNINMLYVSRILCGVMVGALSTVTPMYLAEIAPDHSRGKITTSWQLSITTGIVIGAVVEVISASADTTGNQNFGWRLVLLINLVLTIIYWALLVVFVPESPYWLVMKERRQEAVSVMYMIRPPSEQVEVEVEELEDYLATERNSNRAALLCSWGELFGKRTDILQTVFLGVMLQGFQQLTGINLVIFYQLYTFKAFFGMKTAIYLHLGVGVANQVATYVTFFQVDRFGRVNILLFGSVLMTCSLTFLAATSSAVELDDAVTGIDYLAIVASYLFVISFALSWGPVVWTVTSEMFPVIARGKGLAISTAANWFTAALVSWLFPTLCGDSSTCYVPVYASTAGMCLVGFIAVYTLLPETTGVPLWKVDTVFAKHTPQLFRHTYLDAMKSLIDRRNQLSARTATSMSVNRGQGLEPRWPSSAAELSAMNSITSSGSIALSRVTSMRV